MQKRGTFEISFSMMFSIILIVVFIALASYVIFKFVLPTKCSAESGLFFQDLRDYIKQAWQSETHVDTFTGAGLPFSITYVCFGNLSQTPLREDRERFETIKSRNEKTKNVFLYPPEDVCGDSPASIKLEHVKTNNFFCVPVEKGKINIKTKGQIGQPVLISK